MKVARFRELSAVDAYKVSYWEWIRSISIEMAIDLKHIDVLEVTIKDLLRLPFRILAFPLMPFVRATYIKKWSKRKSVELHDEKLGVRYSFLRHVTIYMRDVDDFTKPPDEWSNDTKTTAMESSAN